jgi:transcriptional antiterminator RfaH
MKGAEDFDQQWYILYTKSRHEKKVADRLGAAGFTVYCPLQKISKRWSDRTKIIEEPLFKGYIFILIEDHKRDEVFSFPGTVRYLVWLRRPAVVRKEEIDTIQKWLGHYDHERLKVTDITPGTYVRITSGKFMNEEGVLLDTSNSKALVQLKELGIQLSLDLTQNELQALQRPL